MPKKYNYKKKENGKNDTGRPELYTLPKVLEELNWMIDLLTGDSDEGRKILFLKEMFVKRGYSSYIFARWEHKYNSKHEFCIAKRKIEDILETRLAKAGFRGSPGTATMAIFLLKNNYNYKDKHEVDQKVDANVDVKGEMKWVIEDMRENKNDSIPRKRKV